MHSYPVDEGSGLPFPGILKEQGQRALESTPQVLISNLLPSSCLTHWLVT